ncbi:MAG: septum formation initiator family protein [Flavobacteriales bacterium]|nr:septum formation initiator family protein [Flavobacteriales bacterium]
MKKWFDRIPSWLKNRYLLVGAVFLVWMLFIDTNSWWFHRELNQEIDELEEAMDYYREEIDRDSTLLHELDSSPEALERYARERYRMKKENEDLFIISEPKEEDK